MQQTFPAVSGSGERSVKWLIEIVLGGFALGAVMMAIANRYADAVERRTRWIKFSVYFVIVVAVLGAAWLGRAWLIALVALMLAIGLLEMRRAVRRISPIDARMPGALLIGYGALATVCLWNLQHMQPNQAAFLYVVIASMDGFSQVTGQLIGRHKLAPRISPGKTVEGAVGGLIAALVLALLIRDLASLSAVQALELGALAFFAGLAGDLAASWLKRRAGIKDFSNLLPGHGGILDRFDSYLAALALCGPLFAAYSP
jgi:phosphatidate cytidylyltransferase